MERRGCRSGQNSHGASWRASLRRPTLRKRAMARWRNNQPNSLDQYSNPNPLLTKFSTRHQDHTLAQKTVHSHFQSMEGFMAASRVFDDGWEAYSKFHRSFIWLL